MGSEVIHHDNVFWAEEGAEDLLHLRAEDLPIRRPLDGHQGLQALPPQRANHRDILPIVERHAPHDALSSGSPPLPAGQRQIHPRFINELEPRPLQAPHGLLILCARLLDPLGVSLARVERLFFRGNPNRWSSD